LTSTSFASTQFVSVAKRKSLFDDKPEEIQQLTFIVKQDIAALNKQIAMLQEVCTSYKKHVFFY
jgi:syntaxin 5